MSVIDDPRDFARVYRRLAAETIGCPIEAGTLGRLADHECVHGRLSFDRTEPCGCWAGEGAAVVTLPPATSATVDRRAA